MCLRARGLDNRELTFLSLLHWLISPSWFIASTSLREPRIFSLQTCIFYIHKFHCSSHQREMHFFPRPIMPLVLISWLWYAYFSQWLQKKTHKMTPWSDKNHIKAHFWQRTPTPEVKDWQKVLIRKSQLVCKRSHQLCLMMKITWRASTGDKALIQPHGLPHWWGEVSISW